MVKSLKQSPLVLNTSYKILQCFFFVCFLSEHIYFTSFILLLPAPQNSRRLTGNWREVAIHVCACGWAVGSSCAHMRLPFLSTLWQNSLTTVCSVPFKGLICRFVCVCVKARVQCRASAISVPSSLPPAETNFICNAG